MQCHLSRGHWRRWKETGEQRGKHTVFSTLLFIIRPSTPTPTQPSISPFIHPFTHQRIHPSVHLPTVPKFVSLSFQPVLEETELNENEAVTVYCSVDTYHREGDVAVRASWKSSSAILLKVTNRVKGVHPLTASQTALFAVNRISRFDSLFCEVEVPICVPGQVDCINNDINFYYY